MIVDDHPIVRQGLAQLIAEQDDLEICGQAEDGAKALAVVKGLKPDVVVVDLSLPDRSGLELVKELHETWPGLALLVLSMHDEAVHAERAIRAGARGYIMKHEATDRVLTAIRRVLAGQVYLSEAMSAQVLNRLAGANAGEAGSPLGRLSDREYQVFTLIGRGLSTRDIAGRLGVSVKTIEAHREHIKEKLGLKNAAELLHSAMRHSAPVP
jgi:DNA-binding NarL/FixJ family response regulator